jgi:hypothetical protein
MFVYLTWDDFFFWLFIATLSYLIIVGWIFYRKDIEAYFKKRRQLKGVIAAPVQHRLGDPLPIVHELVRELGVLIRTAAEGDTIHAELFFSLQNITKNYLILAGTEFPRKINQYIHEELLRFGIPDLSAEEYEALWKERVPAATPTGALIALLLVSVASYAQDGNAGIQDANQKVRSYFQSGTQLMYAVGAIVGLIGAVKVFQKWNAGDHDTGKVAAAWFGSCVFLVVVVTVIKAFFGI